MNDFEQDFEMESDEFYAPDLEPDLDFMFEHDSAMESVGWGTDEGYGSFGEDY